ncbi:DUF1275 domain-containing protein [Burkholderia seminalis]|uniref:YoaK family protein n=1 Tax=Burkholderia seminalis TaxID=488731 RepID=UPI001CF51089|nr:YoaK family protein [Burkholderia seminalis]MCA7951426.1 DUF1275 domain-containing protein [Burkholderia seminalis]
MQPGQVTGSGAAAPGGGWSEDVLLASIAGYVDTLGFVALFGLFTAHVTGNFILIGSGLAGVGQGLAIKLLAFPAFIAGIVAARVLDHRIRAYGHGTRACSLYALQAVLLGGFMLAGVIASPIADADAPATIVCGLLGAAAMGVQNAHGRLTARAVVANTVMTGNVTQAVIDAFDWLVPIAAPAEREAARARLRRTLPPVAAFALGAGAGATAYLYAAFWALALPLAVLGFLVFRSGLRAGQPA